MKVQFSMNNSAKKIRISQKYKKKKDSFSCIHVGARFHFKAGKTHTRQSPVLGQKTKKIDDGLSD